MNGKLSIESLTDTGRVAGSVVLYNSSTDVFSCIKTYIAQIEKLYVIDNSERLDTAIVEALQLMPKVQYISNNGNQGVANALNVAARQAIKDGFTYLLTMDDDTSVPDNLISTMINYIREHESNGRVGILSAVHDSRDTHTKPRRVLTTMTSGNLLNLKVYQQVGPFRDDFFIDHVDHEYGLRLNKANFQVVELPDLVLSHRLGQRKQVGWRQTTYVSHSPIRGYYYVRNGLVLMQEYGVDFPNFKRKILTLLSKELVKAVFLEPNKLIRLKLLWRGFADAHNGRLGKLAKL